MATQTVVMIGEVMLESPKIALHNLNTDALVEQSTATEISYGGGVYSSVFTDVPAATYRVKLIDGYGDVNYIDSVTLTLSTATFPTLSQLPASGGGSGPTAAEIADSVWDEILSEHLSSGSAGLSLNSASSAGDPWSTSLPGAYGAGTAGKIIGDNINATITSRMASYTQPSGFINAVFPTGVASSDNIVDAQTAILARLPSSLIGGKIDASVGAYQSGLAPLQPTIIGRTLDVSVSGEAGIDLANVGSPTTTLNLSGTTISTSQIVASVTNPITLPTLPANWITASGVAASALSGKGDWNVGKTGYSLVAVSGFGNQTGNLSGSVGSISGVIFPSEFSSLSPSGIADQVWDELLSGHLSSGSAGLSLNLASSAGDPWSTSLPGVYASGTAGKIIGDNINATITSRMASYTQPSGFLSSTFPSVVASPTNITSASGVAVTSLASGIITQIQSGVALTTDVTSARNTITALLPTGLVSGRMNVSVGAYQSGLAPLQPTVAGRTIDISVSGEAGIDLDNVGSPTTVLNLSGTTIGTVTSAVTLPTIPVNWITDSGLASSAINEIQSGLATQSGQITASGVRSAVGLATANLDTQLSLVSDKLPSGLINGSIRAYTYEIANDAINVAATDAALVTWIQQDLATTSEINSVTTIVSGVKVKTDQLTFTIPNKVDIDSSGLDTKLNSIKDATDQLITDDVNSDFSLTVRSALGMSTANMDLMLLDLQDMVSGVPYDVITFNLPQSYAGSGIEPTLAQALYMIQQSVTHFDITGTVISVKKLDGTEAATYSLNSATAPTSRRRS
jgi:hypothetical protein